MEKRAFLGEGKERATLALASVVIFLEGSSGGAANLYLDTPTR